MLRSPRLTRSTISALNSGVNDRRVRGFFRSMVSIVNILSGALPLMVDVRQSGGSPTLRSRRLLSASGAAMTAGVSERASTLLDQGRLGLTDPYLLASAEQLDGHLHVATMRCALAPSHFLHAAEQFLSLDLGQAQAVISDAINAFVNAQYLTKYTTGAEIASVALWARKTCAVECRER